MKKFIVLVSLGFLSFNLAFADYKLMIKRGDGVQSEQCIKSYTFSNNFENIARQNGLGKDIYSEKEILTNKIFLGKPVYRKVTFFDKDMIAKPGEHHKITASNVTNNPKNIISHQIILEGIYYQVQSSYSNSSIWNIESYINKYDFTLRTNNRAKNDWNTQHLDSCYVIVEYTKTTDLVDDSLDNFKSYIHYMPSNSENKEIITEEINNAGIQILDNYVYDKDLESCTKK